MRSSTVLDELRALGDPAGREGMARFGINAERALGIRIPALRAIARRVGRDHALAAELWASGIHEARILACFVDDPAEVTEEQMEAWAAEFDSWDLVDQCCANLFDRTPFAWAKAVAWSERAEEFVKRAGFSLMAVLAVHDKKAPGERNPALNAQAVEMARRILETGERSARWVASDALRELTSEPMQARLSKRT